MEPFVIRATSFRPHLPLARQGNGNHRCNIT